MFDRRSVYAFHSTGEDSDDVVSGLHKFVRGYIRNNRLKIANPALHGKVRRFVRDRGRKGYPTIISHLQVVDTYRFRQPDIQSFVRNISESDMIYHRRWGDAPLRMVMAQLFWGPNDILRICEFDYKYANWAPYKMCENRHTKDSVLNALPGPNE